MEYKEYNINEASTLTREEFIKIARQKWADLYRYNQVESKNFKIGKDVRIECKIHGPFNVTPLEHIKGKGCPDCTGSKSFDRKINQQGYIPDTVPEPDMGNIEDVRPSFGTESKDRENKPFYGNRQKPGRKLTHHKTGGGRSK